MLLNNTFFKYRNFAEALTEVLNQFPAYVNTWTDLAAMFFLWLKLVLSPNNNQQANDFIVPFTETQLRQSS